MPETRPALRSGSRPAPRPKGVFAGLATLDIIHRISATPGRNEKVTARSQSVAAGGPATNAAVTFAALGGHAVLLTALGAGPIAATISAELAEVGVEVIDIAPALRDATPVSSVAVLEATGERSVIGADAAGLRAPRPAPELISEVLAGAAVVLLDGHHPELARAVLEGARAAGVATVLDAGRWKPIMAELLDGVSDVVASADFRTPGALTSATTAAKLQDWGPSVIVTTAGPDPVRWWRADGTAHGSTSGSARGSADGRAGAKDEASGEASTGASVEVSGVVEVPQVTAVDTLAAGDVFHGAYAFALASGVELASGRDVERRLRFAAEVAALRCTMVGPRSWLGAIAAVPLERGPR